MFDTNAFAEKAATIAKEKADALAKQDRMGESLATGESTPPLRTPPLAAVMGLGQAATAVLCPRLN